LNYDIFRTINDWSGNSVVDSLMTFFATYVIFIVFAVAAVLCGRRLLQRDLRPVLLVGISLIVTFGLGLVAGALHPELRPFQSHPVHQVVAHASGQSFPSDHATAAFGIALAVYVFLSRAWGAVLGALGLLIGFARVYDGIHYPSDIVGALLVAIVGVGLVALVSGRAGLGPRESRAGLRV
jgi:undecaprenyl-diphosphatase